MDAEINQTQGRQPALARAQHLARRLDEPDRRHGHVGELPDEPHHVVLLAQLVAREDGEVLRGRRDPRDVAPDARLAALVPGRVEDERLAAHAVGVDALQQREVRVAPRRQDTCQPLPQQTLGPGGVPAGPLQLHVGRWP